MKLVALLSGGKDSLYNVLECTRFGHEIVAVGNLRPPKDSKTDELDSEMYQTVGWNGVELIAKAMEVPFYQHYTHGKSVQKSLAYNHHILSTSLTSQDQKVNTSDVTDEVEDLYVLLQTIISKHPQIKGVSCGAILSNYQRTRVESVCERLNLISFSYLWQRIDQSRVLRDMIDCGMEAIIIKCASMGLYPRQCLGKTITELYDTLEALGSEYGMNVAGEGGEYESFVLDCSLFKRYKIEIVSSTIIADRDPITPTGYLRLDELKLVPKCQTTNSTVVATSVVSTVEESKSNEEVTLELVSLQKMAFKPAEQCLTNIEPPRMDRVANYSNNGFFQFVCNPMSTTVVASDESKSELSLDDEMGLIFDSLTNALKSHELTLDNVYYCQFFLNDMSLFQRVNPLYKKHFSIFPPSRVCCQVDLSMPHRISLEALAYAHKYINPPSPKRVCEVLHVQSISEWAPSCIGPYSQATKLENCLIFGAGQIGLNPPTMTLIDSHTKPLSQIQQTWHNTNAVLTVMDSQLSFAIHHNVFILAQPSQQSSDEQLSLHTSVLQSLVEETSKKILIGSEEMKSNDLSCPVCVISVPDLPKHALIEVQSIAVTQSYRKQLQSLKNRIKSVPIPPSKSPNQNSQQSNDSGVTNKSRLKYAHLPKRKKKQSKDSQSMTAAKDVIIFRKQRSELGNILNIVNCGIYPISLTDNRITTLAANLAESEENMLKQLCSFVSVCELIDRIDVGTIEKLLKGAMLNSLTAANGYGNLLSRDWMAETVVFIRLYYYAEAIDPKFLLSTFQLCCAELQCNVVPSISLIPCRGVNLLGAQGLGLYSLHIMMFQS